MEMLRKHSEMRSGRVGKISATENRINHQPGAHPYDQTPYRQVSSMQEETLNHVREQLDWGL